MSGWLQIANAFAHGIQPLKTKGRYIPTAHTLDTGETKSVAQWVIDERNIHSVRYPALTKRAERGITDPKLFFAPTVKPRNK